MALIASLFAGITIALLVSVAVILKLQAPAEGDESWRDKAPLMFRLMRPFVNLFAYKIASSVSPQKLQSVKEKLFKAGLSYVLRPEEFIAGRRVCAGIALLLVAYVYFLLDLSWSNTLLAALLMAVLGYSYPDIWLRDVIKKRELKTSTQFPFFLDVLVLAIRAGLNFASAVAHAVERIPESPVRTEFSRYLRETRTGLSRRDALRNLSERIAIPAVANFVAVINQCDQTGGELGDLLSKQAAQRRIERFQLAEKLANQAPVKMLLPLVGLLFPITLIIIMFPLFIKARDTGVFGSLG